MRSKSSSAVRRTSPTSAARAAATARLPLSALRRLELEHFAERPLGSLSGGELQRAVLARALAQESPVLLLDEPTTALDLGRQQLVLELVDALRKDGLTVVTTMHDLTLAGQYAERLILLNEGAVVAGGDGGGGALGAERAAHYAANVRIVEDERGGVFVLPVVASAVGVDIGSWRASTRLPAVTTALFAWPRRGTPG